MNKRKIGPENFYSDLRNFCASELDILARYTEQFRKNANLRPEMTMYNWPRFVRTNEITRFLTFYETYKLIQDVQGSVFQVGVLEGNTLFTFAHIVETFDPRRIRNSHNGTVRRNYFDQAMFVSELAWHFLS